MIALAAVSALAILALAGLLVRQQREAQQDRQSHAGTILALIRGWERERRELLNRVQHPERTPVEPGQRVEWDPPEDLAELAKVGQIFDD